MFIYNFTKYIQWPEADRQGDFVIGILGGESSLYTELNGMAKTKKVTNQTLAVRIFNSVSDIDKCHILYVPKTSANEITTAAKKVGQGSTLVVTENSDQAKQYAHINFVVVNNGQKFELNKSNVEKNALKVSTTLEKLATTVY